MTTPDNTSTPARNRAAETASKPIDAEATDGISNNNGSLPPANGTANPGRRAAVGIVVLVVLAFSVVKGIGIYRFGQTHVSTDNAYVTGDLVNISPIVSGTLSSLEVEEGAAVKKGQLIARLDDSGPAATLRQAEAALKAAESQIPQAERTLAFTEQSTQAGIRKAQSAIAAQQAKTRGAERQVALSADTVTNQIRQARSQVAAAEAQQAGAEAQAAQADAQVRTAQAAANSYRQAIQTAQRAANAALASIGSARANADRTSKDEARYGKLVKLEAVTQQQYDAARSAAESAESQLTAAEEQAEQAKSAVEQARANVAQAEAQVEAVSKQAVAARKQVEAARQQVKVAQAGLALAKANTMQVSIQLSNVANNREQVGQADADLSNALAGREQIAVRRTQIDTNHAAVDQARAAVENAKVTLQHTYIYAPCDGVVVKKVANVGNALAPGQSIATITQGGNVWVNANFKETQVTDVRAGQHVEIEVDSFPGKTFEGAVESVNRATGAATSLLPPDNATGNFTKVVQRIPIKIVFVPSNKGGKYGGADDIAKLRQGMSVVATIETSGGER